MLARVLEPEVMDGPADARDYDAMDFTAVNARFVADFLSAHGAGKGGEVLDVGTGPARIAITLCRANRLIRVLGIDLAGPMLDLARRNVADAELADRIRFARGDAKHLPFPDGRFAAVISNTIIHHIPDPAPALAEMVRLVAEEGTIFVRDLARPDDLASVEALVEQHTADEPLAAKALFRDSLHAALTLTEIRQIIAELDLDPASVTMTSDRHWTWVWQKPAEVANQA